MARSIPVPRLGPKDTVERGSLLSRGRRFAELVRIARRHGLLPWRRLDFSWRPESSALRRSQAEGLRFALEEAGGAFVKMGQLLSTRTDLLPPEWVDGLAELQHQVTPAPWDDVRALLEAELGAPLADRFATFDTDPISSASIGQVHRATLADGTAVAVKVQRPGIEPIIRRDVNIALRVVSAVTRSSAQARALGVREAAEQYATDLFQQLDFGLEARNLAALRAAEDRSAHPGELVLPRAYPELSTDRVLVLEFLEGETLAALRGSSPDIAPAMRVVLRSFLRQIVFDGVFHADLHPGNIMILPEGRPALVDFGSVGRLDSQLRDSLQELLVAYLQGDNQRIADGLLALAPLREGADEAAFRRALSGFITMELGPGARVSVATVDSLIALLLPYGITVPAELIAAARGFAILEGTLRTTLPEFDLLEESRALAGEQIRDQIRPEQISSLLSRELLALLPGFRRLPRRVERIGSAVEKGELTVNIRVLLGTGERRLLGRLVRQLVLAAVGLVAGVVALGYLTAPPSASPGVLSPGGVGIVVGILAIVTLAAALLDFVVHRR
jgi:ubiquinone biosynthesis protein